MFGILDRAEILIILAGACGRDLSLAQMVE
jgi:hypothetical protein